MFVRWMLFFMKIPHSHPNPAQIVEAGMTLEVVDEKQSIEIARFGGLPATPEFVVDLGTKI